MGKPAFATHFLNNNHQYGRMENIMDINKHINGGGGETINEHQQQFLYTHSTTANTDHITSTAYSIL
jgi:hypothetical protein